MTQYRLELKLDKAVTLGIDADSLGDILLALRGVNVVEIRDSLGAAGIDPASTTQRGPAPTCPHGTRNYREGKNGAKAWAAWMCADALAPDRCEPEWL